MTEPCVRLGAKGRLLLAEAIGESPETVVTVHVLRRGLCRAYAAGEPSRFRAAIVQPDSCPSEPNGFGTDAEALWQLLKAVEGWECINVSRECAPALAEAMEREMGVGVRHYGDIHYGLTKPAPGFPNPQVRLLSLDDLELLKAAPEPLRTACFESTAALLSEGVVAGAIVSGAIVATALTAALTERYADIGVFTDERWRGRGFATAAAALAIRRVQADGKLAVWSTGEDNYPSLRVAEKLGFRRVSERTYLIPCRGE